MTARTADRVTQTDTDGDGMSYPSEYSSHSSLSFEEERPGERAFNDHGNDRGNGNEERAMPRSVPIKRNYRDWLYDRVHGRSRVGKGRPPTFLCYPPPILKCLPALLEENSVCRVSGMLGCVPANSVSLRSWVMLFAFLADLLALNCFVYCVFGATGYVEILKRTPWVIGIVTIRNNFTEFAQVTVRVGPRAVALRDDVTTEDRIIMFDEFCDLVGKGIDLYIRPEDCDTCSNVSWQFVVLPLLVATVLCVPALFTDILREYANYDVNCQRCSAWTTALISASGAVVAWHFFTSECLSSFINDEAIPLAPDDERANGQTDRFTAYEWSDAIGMYCLYGCAGLRALSFLFHCMLPTPTITRSERERREYELLPYEKYDDRQSASSNDEYDEEAESYSGSRRR